VPVSGGTGAERSIIRSAIKLVDPGVVTSARIDKRRYLVLGAPSRRGPGVEYDRRLWETQAFLATVMSQLAKRHHKLPGYAVPGFIGGPGSPRLGPPGADALLAVVFAHAGSAGLDVRSSRILPVGGGAVDVVVRLREEQLFDERAQDGVVNLFGTALSAGGPLHYLAVEAPDGRALAYGGAFGAGGSWNAGGDMASAPVPQTVPPQITQAQTDLTVRLSRARGRVRNRTFHIVCGGDATPLSGRCRHVLADRWALLPPMLSTGPCPGARPGDWGVSVSGRFAGRPASRSYSGCLGAPTKRWLRFLGVK
jgi:hypothetical protein